MTNLPRDNIFLNFTYSVLVVENKTGMPIWHITAVEFFANIGHVQVALHIICKLYTLQQ